MLVQTAAGPPPASQSIFHTRTEASREPVSTCPSMVSRSAMVQRSSRQRRGSSATCTGEHAPGRRHASRPCARLARAQREQHTVGTAPAPSPSAAAVGARVWGCQVFSIRTRVTRERAGWGHVPTDSSWKKYSTMTNGDITTLA
eukprot:scaffold5664_cov115-Isochrysis_galbana.AAC.10